MLIPHRERCCRLAGTCKTHVAIALGCAAVDAGHRVMFFRADALVEQLCRGLADNTVREVIDGILRQTKGIGGAGYTTSVASSERCCAPYWARRSNDMRYVGEINNNRQHIIVQPNSCKLRKYSNTK
jgi:hypothetical protein